MVNLSDSGMYTAGMLFFAGQNLTCRHTPGHKRGYLYSPPAVSSLNILPHIQWSANLLAPRYGSGFGMAWRMVHGKTLPKV